MAGVVGLSTEYPTQVPFDLIANDAGRAAKADALTKCVFEGLFDYLNRDIAEFAQGGLTLEQMLSLPPVREALDAQDLGGARIAAPVYQYHGQADEFLPLDQAIDLKQAYCANGTSVRFDLYQGEHIATQFQAAPYVTDWIDARFNRLPQIHDDCDRSGPEPASTARPGGGSFVVGLDAWRLSGDMFIRGGINSRVVLPAGATFTADADITAETLEGSLSVPTFSRTIRILGLPVQARITLADASSSGSVRVDDSGRLTVTGTARATIRIESAGEFGIHIPIGCRTASPVTFALSYSGPVASLGNGGLRFTGTTTFPHLTGCGIYGPVLSLIFSGSGNTFDFTVQPQAPRSW